jgi:hypothetical protein
MIWGRRIVQCQSLFRCRLQELFLQPIEIWLLTHFVAVLACGNGDRPHVHALSLCALQQGYVLEFGRHLFNYRKQIADHAVICADLRLLAPSSDQFGSLV